MKAELHPRQELPSARLDEMFTLLGRHFERVSHEVFLRDLDEKNWVLLLTDDRGCLRGFTTLDFRVTTSDGRPESVIYSGDTIMDPSSWNSTILTRGWIEAAHLLHARHGKGPLWWLLITSGFRTYRLLPVFWRRFIPHHEFTAPEDMWKRRDRWAVERFGSRFDPATGVVRLDHPQRLREHLAGIPGNRLSNPHVAFYQNANPCHADGDELVCLTRLSDDNLTPAGRRVVSSIRREPVLCLP